MPEKMPAKPYNVLKGGFLLIKVRSRPDRIFDPRMRRRVNVTLRSEPDRKKSGPMRFHAALYIIDVSEAFNTLYIDMLLQI